MAHLYNPHKREYTFAATNGVSHSRIDRFYVNKHQRQNANTFLEPTILPDHYKAQIMEITSNTLKIGRGTWILNRSILNNEGYRGLVETVWKEWEQQKHAFTNIKDWWEEAKEKIKNASRNFSKKQNQIKTKRKTSLRNS